MFFPSTVAGSLPKPSWLAEPNKLWPQWRLQATTSRKASSTPRCWRSNCRKTPASTSSATAKCRASISCMASSNSSTASTSPTRSRWASAPTATKPWCRWCAARSRSRAACTRPRRATPARTPTRKLKITLPGPMTISDTIADAHYGDKVKMAMAFADLLNQEARALQADGVDVIQFDEPAFNVFMDEVPGWGIEALHRAIDGLTCTTAVHICYGYGIKANIEWKNALGAEWTQYEKIFPALAKSRIKAGLARSHQFARAAETAVAARRQGPAGRSHRRRHRRDRNAGAGRAASSAMFCSSCRRSASSPAPIAAWRRCGATSPRPSSWRSAPGRSWREKNSPNSIDRNQRCHFGRG